MALEPFEGGVRVLLGGELFAEYRENPAHQPAVWPIVGPSGDEMTRSWPPGRAGMAKQPITRTTSRFGSPIRASTGTTSGTSLRGLTAARSGTRATESSTAATPTRGEARRRRCHRHAERLARCRWRSTAADERTLAFGATGDDARYIDFHIRLLATDGDVVMNDIKDGAFAVRVPGATKVDAGLGGRIRNAEGRLDGDAGADRRGGSTTADRSQPLRRRRWAESS